MLEHLTLGEFAVAVLMGLAALSAFVWGAVSGAFHDVETIKYQVLDVEEENDDDRTRS
jgi:cbb3-type cytochrome oxidase maturation protein